MACSFLSKAAWLGLAVAALPAAWASGPQPASAGGLNWSTLLDRAPFEAFEAFEAFEPVDADHVVAFPRDHGAHDEAPVEVWSLAAHLETASGEDVGVQFSLARVALVPPDEPSAASAWDVRAFWRGHSTLVQSAARIATGEERLRRGFSGIAAFDGEWQELRMDDWMVRFDPGAGNQPMRVFATTGPAAQIILELAPEKSAMTPRPGTAAAPFIGYALPRLSARGTLTTAEGEEPVSGVAWFEHLWGDLPFLGGPTATDRLVLHFDDGTELVLARTRRRDGAGTPILEGFVVDRRGEVEPVSDESTLTPTGTWRRARSGAQYPIRWSLMLDGRDLEITPLVDDQLHDFVVPVWSGMVIAHGSSGSGPMSGVGTLQLQGYE